MKTKLSPLTLILALSLALSACGGDHENGGDGGGSSSPSAESASAGEDGEGLPLPVEAEEDDSLAESSAVLVGNSLQNAKIIVDEALARAEALLDETDEYFRAHADGNRSAQSVMGNNLRRMEINLRRSSRIVAAWYARGDEPLNNTPRFRSEYSRLRSALRRTRELGNVLHRVARRNEAIATFDGQIMVITSGAASAISELNTVVGRVRAPRHGGSSH